MSIRVYNLVNVSTRHWIQCYSLSMLNLYKLAGYREVK